jgi:hypothetical protein
MMPPSPSPGRDGDELDPFTHEGTVVDVDDPRRAHRIRASIQGTTSKTAWAVPRGGGGGGPQRGGNIAPKIGQNVLISYIGGDRDRPMWEGADWATTAGASEVPTDIVAAGADAALVQAFELRSGDAALRLTVDERPGHRAFKVSGVRHLPGGGEAIVASVELDLEQNVVDLFGMAGIQIRSIGFVDVKSMAVRILKRRVGRSRSPI